MLAVVFGIVGLARHSSLPPVVYAADDPIAPQRASSHDSRKSPRSWNAR